jgi:hypothetical protein
VSQVKIKNVIITLGNEDVKYIENIISVKSKFHKLFLVFLDQVSQNDIDTCLTNNLPIFLCKNSLKSRKDIVHSRLFIHWQISKLSDIRNDTFEQLDRRVTALTHTDKKAGIYDSIMFQFNKMSLNDCA